MELKDTIELMTSPDYKERFKAEYYQLEIRYNKLDAMYTKWKVGILEFTPTCPMEVYAKQLIVMAEYLSILKERAKIEKVEL